jgi:hypothetical protein
MRIEYAGVTRSYASQVQDLFSERQPIQIEQWVAHSRQQIFADLISE